MAPTALTLAEVSTVRTGLVQSTWIVVPPPVVAAAAAIEIESASIGANGDLWVGVLNTARDVH